MEKAPWADREEQGYVYIFMPLPPYLPFTLLLYALAQTSSFPEKVWDNLAIQPPISNSLGTLKTFPEDLGILDLGSPRAK